ncbi:cell division transport system ATP-binding protein [Leucobacter luti]|uniref:Cell division ATP-binding protein FtsE n=1 Tax=Leucobacter luti TaxID=340320 RepID=A0A4R6S457_9MICO|nr:cell division ATP-binding protein FtsE [Leucobacter luti]MCW2287275.1 cell division transport system ATP-binding protein [Leucobacter luti]TCK41498.1 cell division transport system ATP-binding protein [Leucobacter luti]TDP94472.1 cell division transport system ATP-binding protein [Leucobacter luti]
MILFENVTKKYRGTAKPALDGIDLQVDRGEFVFIVGASGSGKSSCLRLILREDQPSVGKIHVLGQDLSKISSRKVPYFRRNLGTVFQDFRLLTNKTVYDNVAFSLQVIGKSRGFIQEAVPDTLEMVGLANKSKRFPHELSGGEQQRVAIARAIVNKPAILLADEPTGNLDPATSLGIMQLLRSINAGGTTVVMATHEATFVDIMQQRVVELSQGVIVRDEQAGGYGETASIPVADLSEAGVRVLRTTEAVVRAALEPEEHARANAAATAGAAAVEEGAGSAAAVAAASAEERAVNAAAAAAAGAAVAAPPTAPDLQAPEASVYEEPRPFDAHDADIDGDEFDETVRADAGPQGKRIPGFLDPGRPIDPVQMSETGNLAAHLGLNRKTDDETDVGPVR